MADELITGVLNDSGLRVLVATTTELSQAARELHSAQRGAAEMLAEALTAGCLLAGLQLQKGPSRVNLQLECDGPLRGLFVDAGTDGTIRGYVKNPLLEIQGSHNEFRYRPALGNSGFLNVLRTLEGGDYYRSSIELQAFDLSIDLERFFLASEQLPAAVQLDMAPLADEALGYVAGVLIQPLPDGDREKMAEEGRRLRQGGEFERILKECVGLDAATLARRLFPGGDYEQKGRLPLRWQCTCSRERVIDALMSTGRAEIQDMLDKDGKAEATCTFCSTVHRLSGDDLRAMLATAQA